MYYKMCFNFFKRRYAKVHPAPLSTYTFITKDGCVVK